MTGFRLITASRENRLGNELSMGATSKSTYAKAAIYESIEVEGRIVPHYTDGRRGGPLNNCARRPSAASNRDGLRFEDWLAVQVDCGRLTAIDVLQYVAHEGAVIAERLIVD